MIKMWFSTLKL